MGNDPPLASIFGNASPPSDDYTGPCPCGCGAVFQGGQQIHGLDAAMWMIEDYRQRIARIRAAALSDADLGRLGALRDFLLRETDLRGKSSPEGER